MGFLELEGEILGFVYAAVLLGVAVSVYYWRWAANHTRDLHVSGGFRESKSSLLDSAHVNGEKEEVIQEQVLFISDAISDGADGFLKAEYTYVFIFMAVFSVILFTLNALAASDKDRIIVRALLTSVAFLVGSSTSMACGYLGMKIAVLANSRVAVLAYRHNGFNPPFQMAFKSGMVMGFSLVALATGMLGLLFVSFKHLAFDYSDDPKQVTYLVECLAGYGLGGSSVALFGRVGGGIFTKAADVGADMFKIEKGLDEDHPSNPAVIADNVGDNVGDIAGMGADLFGSYAEGSCAMMVIASQTYGARINTGVLMFPMILSATGIIVCWVTAFVATHLRPVRNEDGVERALKVQLIVSTILMTGPLYVICYLVFDVNSVDSPYSGAQVFVCCACGLWSGLIIGLITEYYTSNSFEPVREIARQSRNGAATNIIYGLALGYQSVIVPVTCISVTIYFSYRQCSMFGIALGALGILSTLATGLTIDAYGPICDNGGGIVEMSGMPDEIRFKTDALDAAGNTTAAIGKGFAIASAAMVSLALFGGYLTNIGQPTDANGELILNILEPFVFAGLLYGAMLPYWFTAMTMKSVGTAAGLMIVEVKKQFDRLDLMNPNTKNKPDYRACVDISTKHSLNEMIAPGFLVMGSPLIVGYLFGNQALAGLLLGILVSGVQLAISASNSGGAWDNAKKYVEGDMLLRLDGFPDSGKGTKTHEAAVTGDMVGDPMKDTSGPAINILVKLSAITSLVFASTFADDGVGLIERLINAL